MRLQIVGVIGYSAKSFDDPARCDPKRRERIANDARQIGQWLAARGVHLLTGGGGGVMSEVSRGFVGVGSRHGLAFGIIPSKVDETGLTQCRVKYEPKDGYPNGWVEVPIYTQLEGVEPKSANSRNIINVLTSDVMIAFPGGQGTRAELHLALGHDVPTIAYLHEGETIQAASGESLGCEVTASLERVKRFVLEALAQRDGRQFELQLATKQIKIKFTASGEGTLEAVGLDSFPCLAQPGRRYPPDLTVYPADKEEEHYSQEFGVLMKWAIRIWGQLGIYIHEGFDTLAANGGPSAGCIHLGAGNAKRVFDWVDGRTRVQITYPWQSSLADPGPPTRV